MHDDLIPAILDLLAVSLGISTAVIQDVSPAIKHKLIQALDASRSGFAWAELDGDRYLAYRAASPSVPILVAGPCLNRHETNGACDDTMTERSRPENALQAAAMAIERAVTNRQQREATARLQVILDHLPEAVLIVSPNPDRVELANRQVTNLLGWDVHPPLHLDDFILRNQRYTVNDRALTGVEVPLTRALRNGETINQQEIQIERPDGTRARLLVNASPLYDERGEIVSAVAVFQDISRRAAADQFRDDFLALASHELRTPLTAIHGSTYLLLHEGDRLPHETRRELLTDVVSASRKLGDLVENMAQVTTIRAGKVDIQREPISVQALLEDVVADVMGPEPLRPLTVHVGPGLIVLGDPQRLDQVLRNLLYNALKYSPERSPVEITAATRGKMVVITVRDHGPGIAPEMDERIFERFPDGGASDLTSSKGLGLGLYLAKQFVEAQGGKIWIEHPDDGGAEVRFTVPQASTSRQS